MRVDPLIGDKLWFRPRNVGGWGWHPASWEGWTAVAFYLIAVLAIAVAGDGGLGTTVATALLTAALLALCVLKGTRPGSYRLLRDYREAVRKREADPPAKR